MNLKSYFEKGVPVEKFEELLGDNKKIHELHYRKFNPDNEKINKIKSVAVINIIVITEPWCGDSLASLPVLKKMGEINGKWKIKVVLRDENPELIDRFLTNGGRSIPVFLFLEEDFSLIFKWGPRPRSAQKIFDESREKLKTGEVDRSVVNIKIRKFYATDRGVEIADSIIKALDSN